MEPLIDLDLGRQHLGELREAAARAALSRQVAEPAPKSPHAHWRRSIGRALIATGRRLGGEAPVPCPD